MSNRERWIVYPLLFFAVGSAVFTNLRNRAIAQFGTVKCTKLVVASPQGQPRVVLSSSLEDQGGKILIHGPTAGTPNGTLININDVQAEIGAGSTGGFVKIAGAEGVPFLMLGHDDTKQLSGLVATDQVGVLFDGPTNTESVWGTTLTWENVPNANRDYEEAKSQLQSSTANDGADENGADENGADESGTDESSADKNGAADESSDANKSNGENLEN